MKVVLDTNVLVSALLSTVGPPAQIFNLVLNQSLQLCVGGRIFNEDQAILTRQDWPFSMEDAMAALVFIQTNAIYCMPEQLQIDVPDPEDLMFISGLESAGVCHRNWQ